MRDDLLCKDYLCITCFVLLMSIYWPLSKNSLAILPPLQEFLWLSFSMTCLLRSPTIRSNCLLISIFATSSKTVFQFAFILFVMSSYNHFIFPSPWPTFKVWSLNSSLSKIQIPPPFLPTLFWLNDPYPSTFGTELPHTFVSCTVIRSRRS